MGYFSLRQHSVMLIVLFMLAVSLESTAQSGEPDLNTQRQTKPVIYQVFTRLFGNKNTANKPWGTIEENGVGKFSDINDEALREIKALGVSHIWYTGVPHHASVTDYSHVGIPVDDPDVVKGRAGSPYAVRDYYNVDPDLADDPRNRLAEFEALVSRTHRHGLKVLIDIVPNHVARRYESLTKPKTTFGLDDDVSKFIIATTAFTMYLTVHSKFPNLPVKLCL